MIRTALSRADLLRLAIAVDVSDDARLTRLARRFGFCVSEHPERSEPSLHPLRQDSELPLSPPVPPAPSAESPFHAFCLTERHRKPSSENRPESEPESHATDFLSVEVDSLPDKTPLVPWSRLWPLVRSALSASVERHRIDVPRLVAAQARLRPLRRLPRLRSLTWASAGQLILDLSPRLYPFWGDFSDIKQRLPKFRGATGLEILAMEQGPEGPVRAWDGENWGDSRSYRAPAADVPVLILGDLGCLDLSSEAERQAWLRLGQRLRADGRQAVVLTPCPSRWWDKEVAGLYFPVVLDFAARIPPRPGGARPWPTEEIDRAQALREERGAAHLLALLDAGLCISPALLRHLRQQLSGARLDVGSEAAAWQHPARQAGAFGLLPGQPVESERLQASVCGAIQADDRQLAWTLIRAQQRAHRLSRAVCMEERIRQAALMGTTDVHAEDFQNEVAQALEIVRREGNRTQEQFLVDWVGRLATRMSRNAWKCSPRSEALWLRANPEAASEIERLPRGLDIHRARAAQGLPAPQERVWRIVQRGAFLEIEPEPPPDSLFLSGSLVIGRIRSAEPVMQVRENRPDASEYTWPLRAFARLPLNEPGWHLRTEHEEMKVQPRECPPWAHTLGCDPQGLFVEFDDGRGDRHAYWCAQGHGHPEWLNARTPLPDLDVPHGFFMDAAQLRGLREEGFYPRYFGDTLRVDDYGLRGEIRIRGIPIGMRWIWPGTFLMGSSESEEWRDANERQHEVTLTRGFWLAETVCTQALWEAVTGQNPSGFKGGQRPVEQVSWEDAQQFIGQLNQELAGFVSRRAGSGDSSFQSAGSGAFGEAVIDLRFRLPTEAEWEYACRAGTTGAYSFGDHIDQSQVNFGTMAMKTVDVTSLPANAWGLYEMHGNVWEWCQDWWGKHSYGSVMDPPGPATGGFRVLRGGSWFDKGPLLRSSSRYGFDPDDRSHGDGFRLALGPEFGQAGGASQEGRKNE